MSDNMDTNGLKIGDWVFDYSYKGKCRYKVKKRLILDIHERQKGIVLAYFDSKVVANVKSLLLWEPVHGELVWVKDTVTKKYYLCMFDKNILKVWKETPEYIEPYVGEVPQWTKNIKRK